MSENDFGRRGGEGEKAEQMLMLRRYNDSEFVWMRKTVGLGANL